jgi:hypothetical protein
MMAGARNVHDDIVVNLLAELRGSSCRPFAGDGAIELFRAKSGGRTPVWTADN